MNRLFYQILICISAVGIFLYAYVEKQNQLTALRLRIPKLEREVKVLQETNIRLHYEIEQFESPIHLMELSRNPEFGHLKHPYLKDIVIISESQGVENEQ
jgi:uncharacterized protein YlxW (UPF0749 family)